MKAKIWTLMIAVSLLGMVSYADDAEDIYATMKTLKGEWVLSPADKQEGEASKNVIVAPLVGTDRIGMKFRIIGLGSTVQEILLPDTQKEMVTMYHCMDAFCGEVKATHYCVMQNQPEMLADEESTETKLIYNCNMETELCQSDEMHIHKITHELSNNGKHLKSTYSSWKDGEYSGDIIYVFDRKEAAKSGQ